MAESVPSPSVDEFAVSLRIRHPSIDPDEITRALGFAPQHCFRAGERRRTDTGEPQQGRYRESYWTGRFREATMPLLGVSGTEAALTQAVQQLQRSQSFLSRLQEEGASIELVVETEVDSTEFAFSLSPRLLAMLTRCGVSLLLEVRAEPRPAARRLAG